jgi:hypothetical protein
MSLSDKIKEIRARAEKELNKKQSSEMDFGKIELSIPEVPRIKEKRGTQWVQFGEDNLYPQKISDLKYGSPIHNAIVSTASDMIAGDGFLINDAKTPEESLLKYNTLTPEQKVDFDLFINNPNYKINTEGVVKKLSFDIKEQGAIAYEVIYNQDFTRITTVKPVDVRTVRAGKMINDEVKSYWISRDWCDVKLTENKPKEIAAYDPKDKNNMNQLVYEKIGNLDYYGVPDWVGCVMWVETDYQMGIFHLSNIENGMNPSMKLQFYKLPNDENDKQTILNNIKKQYVGSRKTGRHMVFFSDGKELAPSIDPIQTSQLDKQLIVLAELCDKKILTGHKLTSPLLAGVSVSGQIGGNTELEKAYQIYLKTRIAPLSKVITDSINKKVLEFNKTPVKITINPYNIF